MAELNINNLALDDNTYKLLEEGTYHFKVTSHEIDYYSGNSTKIPPNTQQVICNLEIPFTDENGSFSTVTVKNNLNIYSKMLFLVRQFAECIKLCSEKGKENVNLDNMDEKTGICEIAHREGNDGNTYMFVKTFYAPSKAPKVTMNDAEFEKYLNNDFVDTDNLSVPFEDKRWN